MEEITYEWIRSHRKTSVIQVREDGRVIVRTPYFVSRGEVERSIEERMDWIRKNQEKLKEASRQKTVITEEMRKDGVKKALKLIPERVEYFAGLMGVSYGRITIREQKTRWGSCSCKGNLNFNWKLMLMPPEILDYVVVHELAHRKEMNHSRDFWKIVEQVLPDYQERRKRLRELA
ncbi:MAG: M48 family metallopeptidase [Dorea sp.]|jgi:predicted metal-dependent hydrolase|nr:M48 family metallopeptidase [Dorea sp.]